MDEQTGDCLSRQEKLTIFVHRASECLTDHEAHGDGLICFSLLNGLAERGHRIFAYANRAPIRACHPNLQVRTAQHRVPANSLAPWEHGLRADRWLRELARNTKIDLVWRMHPYHGSCPAPPDTQGRPLVIGPMFYGWPADPAKPPTTGRPRLGVGIEPLARPFAERGWRRALAQASLLICATRPHTEAMRRQVPGAKTLTLPVIVEPPQGQAADPDKQSRTRTPGSRFHLLFVANLVAYKNPLVFCETLSLLRARGAAVQGTLIGDGPERKRLEAYCQANGLQDIIRFAGKTPNAEVYLRLQQADALVSLSEGEPYGRSIVEAMSVGTPVICHRSGGPADFITDGVDGVLVDELTPGAYAQAVAKLIASRTHGKGLPTALCARPCRGAAT